MPRKKEKRKEIKKKTSVGLDENLEALLAYLLGWITGIIFYLLEKDSKFVKFHALQSTIVFIGLSVVAIALGIIPFIGFFFSGIVTLVAVVVWIVCMIKAYQGEWFKLPVAGEIAEKNLK
ncbi:MAG: DUF4870 domain-containing protein [Candidatus Aenigmatarchaeota archaeon]